MTNYLVLDHGATFRDRCDARASDLFNTRDELEVLRLRSGKGENGDEKDECRVVRRQDVINIKQLEDLNSNSNDEIQILFIRQDRSWTTLNITRNLFEDMLHTFQIYQPFWRCTFTFGRKFKENNFDFPPFHFRWSQRDAFECTYVLRRVELHKRAPAEGQGHWSIRQSAVYHRADLSGTTPDRFVIISPSESGEDSLEESLEIAADQPQALSPFNIHRILIADSSKNWQEYLASLESELKEQSYQALLAKVGTEKDEETVPPQMNFNINFLDRQRLKQLKDTVIDAQIILDSMTNYTKGIRFQAERYCKYLHTTSGIECDCISILDEFHLHIAEVELHIRRANKLSDRAEATAKLLSDLLQHDEAVSLKKLGHESQKETIAMYSLTEQSTKDAKAVKILTVIALVYLPTSIVANFFSTQFVHSDNNGNLQVSSSAWMLAAFSVPLTVITFAVWLTWIRYFTEPEVPQGVTLTLIKRLDSFKSIFSKRKHRDSDLEAGSNVFPSSPSTLIGPAPTTATYSGSWADHRASDQTLRPNGPKGMLSFPPSPKSE